MLEPAPTHPKHVITVTVDSIPSGADVYAIEKDGTLGAKVGTTPFEHTCGVAPQFEVFKDTMKPLRVSQTYGWGTGTLWKLVGPKQVLLLNLALAKGDHSLAVASKEIWIVGEDELRDKAIALTVPLKTLAQVNQEVEMHLRQQGLNQRQNINVQQQKDGLDSINGGLDALIKLRGLGAFSR